MPVVPRSPGPQVATRALPGPRVSTGAPSAAFGVQTQVDLSGPMRLLEEERAKADQIHINGADAQLYDTTTKLESEGLSRRGMDAMGATQAASDGFQKSVSEIRNGLTSERQRMLFDQRAGQHWASLHSTLERHADAESKRYDAETTKAIMDGASNEALKHADEPEMVAGQIAKQQAAFSDFLSRNGVRGELAQQRLREQASMTHASVITHLLNQGKDLGAAGYFAKHREELVGDDLLQTEKLVDTGSLRAESQRESDRITGSVSTLTDGLKQAKAIEDPRVRDETEQRVRRHFADLASDQAHEQAAAFHEASAIMEKTGDFHKIPLALRVKMSPEENSALQHREDQIRHPKRETHPDVYNSLMNMAGINESSRKQFETLNLPSYRNQLSEEDFNSLLELQLRLRLGTMNPEISAERRATEQAAKRQATIDAMAKIPGMTPEAIALLRNLSPPPNVPGAPIAPAVPIPPTDSALAAPHTRQKKGGVQQQVPQTWVDHAHVHDPKYKTYLDTLGLLRPASPGVGDIDLRAPVKP